MLEKLIVLYWYSYDISFLLLVLDIFIFFARDPLGEKTYYTSSLAFFYENVHV